jgi:hypothetical protein
MPRPVTRESYLSPDVMVAIENQFPKRQNFAALAGVHVQVLHRLLNQQGCHAEDVEQVTRAWEQYNARAVRDLLNKPPGEWTFRDRLQLYRLVTSAYEAAYGTEVPG